MNVRQIPHDIYIDTLVYNAEQILDVIGNDYTGDLSISFSIRDGFKQVEDILMGLNHKPNCFKRNVPQKLISFDEEGICCLFEGTPSIKDSLANLCDMYLTLVEGTALKADGRGYVRLSYAEGLSMDRQVFGRYARHSQHSIEIGETQGVVIYGDDD